MILIDKAQEINFKKEFYIIYPFHSHIMGHAIGKPKSKDDKQQPSRSQDSRIPVILSMDLSGTEKSDLFCARCALYLEQDELATKICDRCRVNSSDGFKKVS